MTVPLERRSEVPCSRCGYHFRRHRMLQIVPSGKHECIDRAGCNWRIAERERLDAWKRGQR